MTNGDMYQKIMIEAINDNPEFCEEYIRKYVEGGVGKLIKESDHIPRDVLIDTYFRVVAELYHCEG